MSYSVIQVVNGNYAIAAECGTLKQAKVNFHNLCASLWNDTTVPLLAHVEIVDQALNKIDYETIEIVTGPEEE